MAERGPFKKGEEREWKDKAPGRALPLPPQAHHTDSGCPDVGVAVGDRWCNVCVYMTGLSALPSLSPPPSVLPLFLPVPLLFKSATGGPHASPRLLHNVTFHLFRLPSSALQPNYVAGAQGAGLERGEAAALSQ